MAQIDIGKLKPTWKSAYNNSTAYVVDDMVSYQNQSYICKLASTGNVPTNTTYWALIAAKGSDGTDADLAAISGTVQGDLYYNNGSAIARLAPGSASQVLQSGGAGANPSWGTVSSDYVKLGHSELGSSANSITMSNMFSTTYDVYHVYFSFLMDTTTQAYMELEKSSDSSFQNSNYYFNSSMSTRNNSSNSVASQGDWSYGNFRAHENQANSTVNFASWHLQLIKPMDTSTETRWHFHLSMYDGSYSRELVGGAWNGNAEAHSGLKFTTTSGNFRASSSVSVYGLKHA